MGRQVHAAITTAEELFAADEAADMRVCERALADPGKTKYASTGAHDPTPTPYFVLDQLFEYFDFDAQSHLLDVGCGLGRVLAHFVRRGYQGRATGVEMDPALAGEAQAWASRYDNLQVICGDVLEQSLSGYTHFYLFNPFDTSVLLGFIADVEDEATGPVTLVHMSDNGETHFYEGRPGWSQLGQGQFDYYVNDRGYKVLVYDGAQHYSAWRFDPSLR